MTVGGISIAASIPVMIESGAVEKAIPIGISIAKRGCTHLLSSDNNDEDDYDEEDEYDEDDF